VSQRQTRTRRERTDCVTMIRMIHTASRITLHAATSYHQRRFASASPPAFFAVNASSHPRSASSSSLANVSSLSIPSFVSTLPNVSSAHRSLASTITRLVVIAARSTLGRVACTDASRSVHPDDDASVGAGALALVLVLVARSIVVSSRASSFDDARAVDPPLPAVASISTVALTRPTDRPTDRSIDRSIDRPTRGWDGRTRPKDGMGLVSARRVRHRPSVRPSVEDDARDGGGEGVEREEGDATSACFVDRDDARERRRRRRRRRAMVTGRMTVWACAW